jgi:cell division protein FtsZ
MGAIGNPLLEASMARCHVSISGGMDMTLFEVDEAATRIREKSTTMPTILIGAICDNTLVEKLRVVVATGLRTSADVILLGYKVA